jgi:phytoene synthase
MRLAWWREAIEEIASGRAVRGHPVARALRDAARRRALPYDLLFSMIEGRIEALDHPRFNPSGVDAWATGIGGATAWAAAALLGDPEPDAARSAGEAWALAELTPADVADPDALAAGLEFRISAARLAVRRLGPAAFPAVAHVSLIGTRRRPSSGPSPVRKRLRLFWAVARGRI